jgi:organic hydroperoxide reductase OsmC/OhrA
MNTFTAQIHWQRQTGEAFTDKRYSRGHVWHFDGGVTVPGSSSPHSVKLPYSVAEAVDPEEAFVASISSCHMLWFLDIASRAGWVVDDYVDDAQRVRATAACGSATSPCARPCALLATSCPTCLRSSVCTTARTKSASSPIPCAVMCRSNPSLSKRHVLAQTL